MKKRLLYFVRQDNNFSFTKIFTRSMFAFFCSGPFGQFYSGNKFAHNFEVQVNEKLVFADKRNFKTFLVNFKNSLSGVSFGFFTLLKLKGVGFRAWVDADKLVLVVGFSHYLLYKIPVDVLLKAKKSKILIFGVDKNRVSEVAAEIQSLRKPDVYKGKGIQYMDRNLILKVGKQR
jgi:ribosomal protein L6P/L9E